jgi:formylglycine-generating enzyme required for sulfatase activity/CHAT domain-containing protein
MNYLDFELEIAPGSGREYPIAVVRSPAGEARELENRLKNLQIALLRSGGRRRRVLTPEQQAVRDFGKALFDALLTGEVRGRYDVSQHKAAQDGTGLRVKLRILSPELAALPWEFLYDARRAEYVCLSTSTPLVRYLELSQPSRPLSVTPPLRVLGMVASPENLDPLDVAREKQRVEEALAGLKAAGLVALTWLEGQTWRNLQRAMRHGPWNIFHFIGHGGFDRQADEGFIALADRWGEAKRLTATHLARLLADHRSLRLALLNACEGARGSSRDIFSSTAAILVRRGLPAVLAMQYEITDRSAIEFASTFYEALADGLAVDTAVSEARKAVSLAVTNTLEWGTPVLHMRAPDGVLFDVREGETTPAPQVRRRERVEPTSVLEIEAGELLRPALIKLHRILSGAFDGEEFRTLCFYLSVNYDSLRGEGLASKARELIAYSKRQGRMGELVELGRQMRPDVDWGGVAPMQEAPVEVRPAAKALPDVSATRHPFEPEVILIPAGEFLMGSDPKQDKHAYGDEQPQHTLYLPDYCLAKTPVTNAQYLAFVQATGHPKLDHWKGGKPPSAKEDHPVVYVSWHDAVAYCRWLAEATDKPYRLPSETEWEKGARGADGRLWPWGNRWDPQRCNSEEDGQEETMSVGAYPQGASPYGCLDMAGNVWEWTSSLKRDYPYDAVDGREDPEAEGLRVLRGGAFRVNPWVARCAFRGWNFPIVTYVDRGFRVVVAPGPTSGTLASGAIRSLEITNKCGR